MIIVQILAAIYLIGWILICQKIINAFVPANFVKLPREQRLKIIASEKKRANFLIPIVSIVGLAFVPGIGIALSLIFVVQYVYFYIRLKKASNLVKAEVARSLRNGV